MDRRAYKDLVRPMWQTLHDLHRELHAVMDLMPIQQTEWHALYAATESINVACVVLSESTGIAGHPSGITDETPEAGKPDETADGWVVYDNPDAG